MSPLTLFLTLSVFGVGAFAEPQVQIGVKHRPSTCDVKADTGDTVSVHYTGTLADGAEFDSSYNRGQPLDFQLGSGQVIQGWEVGVHGACVGEKRKLKIPPELGYGETGAPPVIPGGATLVFEIEVVDIKKPT